MAQPGGIPAEKHRLLGGTVTVQFLGVSSNPVRFRHAPGDGMLDALILWRNERERAAPVADLLAAFELKTRTSLALLEEELPALEAGRVVCADEATSIRGCYRAGGQLSA